MVNFDYGLEIYANDILRCYFNAYSLFIFHDEDRLTMTKQVMFGHVNASNQMVTTEDFYKTLPDRIRTEKFGGMGGDVTESKQKISFELVIDEAAKR